MLKKQLMIGLLTSCLSLIFLGSAFAGDIGSEAGAEVRSSQAAVEAAASYNYNQERLAQIGTEAGVHEFKFNAPETNADVAANNYDYNPERLNSIGTEAGYDSRNDLLCATC